MAEAGWTPNAISVGGMVIAVVAGVVFWLTSVVPVLERVWFLLGAVLVQMRLLANMFDGMVAVESDLTSPVGELYNEVPDRVSDTAILVGLGYAAGGSVVMGMAAAVAAVFTAYVRVQSVVAGAPQDFCGPMAKPQRMFVVTLVALWCGVTPTGWQPMMAGGFGLPTVCLLVVLVGSVLTALRRLVRGGRALRA